MSATRVIAWAVLTPSWALPFGADNSRAIVYTHGGGFAVGSADSHRKLAGHLAKALNVTAVVLHYRRAPEHPFPAQIEDAVAAYKALLEKGFDAAKLSTAGDSAGGNLAIASVLKMRDLRLPLPGSVIALSPWLDMALRGATLETNSATDALVGRGLLEAMVGMFLGGKTDPRDPLANPLENDFRGFPPLYITAGGFETLFSNYRPSTPRPNGTILSVVPGMQHVFPALAGRGPEADEEMSTHRPLAPRAQNLRRPDPAPVPAGGCFLENGAVGFIQGRTEYDVNKAFPTY